MDKPRVIKDYEKLDLPIQEQIKLNYPRGFEKNLVKFQNKEGKMVSALPFETEDKYYLIRMTVSEAIEIIEDDDDYDDLGLLKDEVKEELEEKHDGDDDLEDVDMEEEMEGSFDDDMEDD